MQTRPTDEEEINGTYSRRDSEGTKFPLQDISAVQNLN